jgi:hypothetical protein
MDLMGILGSVLGQGGAQQNDDQIQNAFDQFSQGASRSDMASALMGAFGSNETPAFGNMLGSLFGNASGDQKAGLLNTILAAAGPALLSQVLSGRGMNLSSLMGGQQQFTPEMAQQIPTEALEDIAAQTGQNESSLIGSVSNFFAENPTLVKTLGAAAVGVALNHFMNNRRQS